LFIKIDLDNNLSTCKSIFAAFIIYLISGISLISVPQTSSGNADKKDRFTGGAIILCLVFMDGLNWWSDMFILTNTKFYLQQL